MTETPSQPRSGHETEGGDAADANHASDSVAAAAGAAEAAEEEPHPFETDPGDHAETPFEAYQHLDLLLTRLAKRLGVTKAALRIYDPFYCEGRMVAHLARLGFTSVYNRNEDFYALRAAGRCPEFDVLVTNPPFSGDHLEQTFGFAVRSNKPWCLLIPQYCGRKAFFLDWLNHGRPRACPRPSFLAPTHAPYAFTAPNRADVRELRVKEPDAAAAGAAESQPSAAGQAETAAAAEEPAAAGGTAVEASLAALSLADPTAPAAATGQQAQLEEPASAAASDTSAADKAFEVAAGSFQCVWFFHLGKCHHKPVFEWLQQQQQQQEDSRDETTGAAAAAAGLRYTVVVSLQDVPQLMAAPKLSPAERRWRKKQAALAAAGVMPSGEQQQQQQREAQQGRGGRQDLDAGREQQGRRRGQQQQQPSEQQQQAVRMRKPPPPERKPPPAAFALLAELDADA